MIAAHLFFAKKDNNHFNLLNIRASFTRKLSLSFRKGTLIIYFIFYIIA